MKAFPDKKYRVILADPPWRFETYSERGKGRSPERHYECMSLDDIAKLAVGGLADEDCALFLWATWPMLRHALSVIDAWGFTYKTMGFLWAKTNRRSRGFHTGLGYWTRANTEPCLLATRGHPKRVDSSVPQLVVAPVMQHSRKPPVVRNRIARLLGESARIELFAREAIPGWDRWGLEAP